jgi:hypothetical protein
MAYSDTQLAKELGIDRTTAWRWRKEGMPSDDLEAAQAKTFFEDTHFCRRRNGSQKGGVSHTRSLLDKTADELGREAQGRDAIRRALRADFLRQKY